MKSHTAVVLTALTACLLTACGDRSDGYRRSADPDSTTGSRSTGSPVRPDNSGINRRDANSDLPTAGNQSEAAGDVDRTKRIRQAVVADDSLSVAAQNVKIITLAGRVTLRGPVDTEDEKSRIVAMATHVAGASNVDDQIEVRR